MNDAETEAAFAELVEGINITTDAPEVDYTMMPLIELSNLFTRVKNDLLNRGELITQETEHGKDLGGMYHGCLLELRRRGIF